MLDIELPPPSVHLVVGEGEESRRAAGWLKERGVHFGEIKPLDPWLKRLPRPTLLVYGRTYVGLERIKEAIWLDPNIWS